MEALDAFAARFNALQAEIVQAPGYPAIGPEMLAKVNALAKETQGAVRQELQRLQEKCAASAQEYAQKATAARAAQEKEAARARGDFSDVEWPEPWEDHQGLSEETIHPHVLDLLHVAQAAPPGARLAGPSVHSLPGH